MTTPSTKREELEEQLEIIAGTIYAGAIIDRTNEPTRKFYLNRVPEDSRVRAGIAELLVLFDTYARSIAESVIEEATDIDNTNCAADHLDGGSCTTENHHYRSGRFDAAREITERAEAKLEELIPKGKE